YATWVLSCSWDVRALGSPAHHVEQVLKVVLDLAQGRVLGVFLGHLQLQRRMVAPQRPDPDHKARHTDAQQRHDDLEGNGKLAHGRTPSRIPVNRRIWNRKDASRLRVLPEAGRNRDEE